ncbi:PAS domain S-box protein [Peredibacter sp. HCB2-198]|uniref:sensor histidine kinase n=1 Tax=Peredibacter sp. HCB2-198 TaxID=3383025 RepID=UPI0038B58C34
MSKTTRPWTKEELQEIVNLPTHLVAIIAADGTLINVGPVADTSLGWEPHEIQGMNLKEFIHPDDIQKTSESIQELLKGSKDVLINFTNRCLGKDGGYHWINWGGRASGGKVYALGTDVTDKIQFEQELNLQAMVLESISEGVLICNKPGIIAYANTAEEMLFGYEPEELNGKPLQTLNAWSSEESEFHLRDVMDTIRQKGVWKGEWLNRKKNGDIVTTACRVTPLTLNGEKNFVIVQRDISQEKQKEQEQERTRNRFKTFFEQSILPMEIYNLEGDRIAVNKAWCELFNLGPDEFHNNILKDSAAKEVGLYPYVLRAYAGEAVDAPAFLADLSKYSPKGRSRWIEAWLSPIFDENKKVIEIAIVLKDVTESRETQSKLERSIAEKDLAENRLSMAVNAGKIGIWEWKPSTNELHWDHTLSEIYGYEKGQYPKSLEEYEKRNHSEDNAAVQRIIKRAIQTGEPYVVEHRIWRLDGQVRWIQGSGTAFKDETGKVILLMGTVMDITDKKVAVADQSFLSQTSEILSSSFNYLENLQKMADFAARYFCDGCLIDQLHPDGTIKRIVVGGTSEEMKEKLFSIHNHYPQRYTQEHPLFISLITGRTVVIEDMLEYSKSYWSKYPEAYFTELDSVGFYSAIVVRLKGKENLLGTITFFTTRNGQYKFDARSKWLAEELAYRTSMSIENSLLYLHSQEAIKSRDEFLSIASHELKTPLTSLTLQNQMRKRQLEKDKSKVLNEKTILKMIEADDRQLRRINRLIDDMLDIARIRAEKLTIHKEQFEFCAFVKDVIERLNPQMQAAGCELTAHFCPSVTVVCDSYRIEQVVVNMLTNAMKYGAGRPINIEVTSNNLKVSLMVHDQGPGIDTKDLERIFQRFERAVTGREISGLGLGLYISRQIVELHDGALFVTSEIGRGSTFIMELPLDHG